MTAVALLVRRFGKRIEGGGFEVEVTFEEMAGMSPHGVFKETPRHDLRVVKWQYFPNDTIDVEGHVVPDGVTPEGATELPEKTDSDRPIRPDKAVGQS